MKRILKWLRRGVVALMLLVAVTIAMILLAGCTTTVRPPADVGDPVTVYVIDHGRTPSLLLPTPEGRAVRYAYGDWVYYAEAKRNPLLHGVPALVWPTSAAVGRQGLDQMPAGEADAVESATRIPVDQLHPLVVERDHAESLYHDLESHFREHWDEHLENPLAALTFVPHPDRYTLAHDSNRMVARWLGQLGVASSGPFWAINWRIVTPED